jgi:hypothetical protein
MIDQMEFSAFFNFLLLSRYDFYFAHDFIVSRKHYYQDPYVHYSFKFILNEDNLQKPQYFTSSEVLSNGYTKQSKFKQHLQTVNPQNVKDTEVSFKIKPAWLQTKGTPSNNKFTPHKKSALEASYCVALKTTKEKSHIQ